MEEKLAHRLKAFVCNQIITPQEYLLLEDVAALFEKNSGFPLTDSHGGMFLAHLASAMHRSRLGEEVASPAAVGVQQLEACPQYSAARCLTREILDLLDLVLPQGELDYMLIHLCNLLREEKSSVPLP